MENLIQDTAKPIIKGAVTLYKLTQGSVSFFLFGEFKITPPSRICVEGNPTSPCVAVFDTLRIHV